MMALRRFNIYDVPHIPVVSFNRQRNVVTPPVLLCYDSITNSSANYLHSLSDTKFCESVLLPTDHTMLKKSLQATLFNARNDADLNDTRRLDSCCRSVHKCEPEWK